MIRLIRTDSKHVDFHTLVKALDAELAVRDGDDHDFYHQFNGIQDIHHVLVGYINDEAVACGAIKHFDKQRMEVKRMFVSPSHRGNKYAMDLLDELENWAKELGYTACILETGKNQPEAIRLYHKALYSISENYGQYAGIENSICFRKEL